MRSFEDWLPSAVTIAIAGICKNAGKTSLVNHILDLYPEFNWAVFSTGIDGEETDTVFKTPKPRVKLPGGSLFVCDTRILNLHKGDIAVIIKLPNAGRPLWIARALTALETEITGPASQKAQTDLIFKLKRLGAQKVIVDGSLDRKAIAHSPLVEAMILAVGASFGSMNEILDELQRIQLLSRIQLFKTTLNLKTPGSGDQETILIKTGKSWIDTALPTVIGNEASLKKLLSEDARRLMIPGALSSRSYKLLKSCLAKLDLGIIVQHPDRLKLELKELQELLALTPVRSRQSFCVKGLALNSWAAGAKPQDADVFRNEIRKRFPDWESIDIMEYA